MSHRKKTARVCLFKLLMKLFSSPVFTVLAGCQRQLLSASGPAYSGVSHAAPRNLPVRTFAAVKWVYRPLKLVTQKWFTGSKGGVFSAWLTPFFPFWAVFWLVRTIKLREIRCWPGDSDISQVNISPFDCQDTKERQKRQRRKGGEEREEGHRWQKQT